MIHFISRYFYELNTRREYWLTQAERRKAFWMACGIAACLIILALIWLK